MKRIEEKLTAIGDAIREKTGGTELLSLDEMPSEITSIETGIKTDDATAVAGDILSGKTAYAKDVKITGTIPTKTQGDLTVSEATVTVPSGYYATDATKSVATATQATPSISVDSAGKITASATQTAGYVSAGTKSATKQLTTKATATITPSTSNQTIAAGTYLTGVQTIAGDADLVAGNIKKGVNIFGVAGSYEGVELNFNVVGGTSQPTSPKSNTIWVNTSTTITSWVFSPTQTSGAEGMVWIQMGTSSPVAFNALKENRINIFPLIAKQYVSGAWVNKTAKIYQSGKWNDFVNELYLYKNGTFSSQGGNLTQRGVPYGGSAGSCTLNINTSNVTIGTYAGKGALVYFTNKIDLTDYSTLYFNGSVVDKMTTVENERCAIGVWKSIPTSNAGTEASASMTGYRAAGIHSLDISKCTGEHYVGIAVHGFGENTKPYLLVTMNQMYLR